ncbi:uncharacterized protein N7483_005850 [Penicillium malachiteum]|uniref:uncharacterized protein n=1 Tax=Penicillium malachiteum TaxID=1324776 RepID=UPI00254701B7|nr:uncharacterized protein N7483_005850 [Penicillium malachiteum]KAJ5731342.1 hypothetical protein N7483_005850 [Penicillium malachiteum]
MDQPRQIHHLADELVNEILAFILESGPQNPHGKLYINGNHSQDNRRPIAYGEASDLDCFRLVCKRFMRIGTPRKFARFNLRFSEDGFRRLGELLEMQRACYVKTVTYLVRPFYQGSGWRPILQTIGSKNRALAQLHSQRLEEQTNLVETNFDLSQLCLGIAAFSALQEIKLLRLQDEADEHLLDLVHENYIRGTETMDSSRIWFDWESACSRAVTNLGIALLNSQCSAIRFIGPHISPEATLQLLRAPSTTLAAMGNRLTSLDINFHSHSDITATMSDLSSSRFTLDSLQKPPLDLDLESIFHNIRWKTLRTLSLQGWRLDADEIISLIRRHRRQLRDFRLFAVYLRPRGRWKDVLCVLRNEMERLDSVELREIDYTEHFDALARVDGIEVFDTPLSPSAPSSISFAAGTTLSDQAFFSGIGLGSGVPIAHGRRIPIQRTSLEKLHHLSTDDLGDSGIAVQREQVQFWAAWVLSGFQRGIQNTNGHENNGNGNGHSRVPAYHI